MSVFAATTPGFPLSAVDAAIVAGYLLAMLGLGTWVGRGQKTTVDYFLGNRSLPWWAVLLSIVATETSTVTFLSIPGMAFAVGGDMRFLQITFGYIIGRLVAVFVLLPLYFRGEPFTAYEVLQRRFGTTSRRATSLVFLVTRNLADALRLFLSALVLQEAVGLDLRSAVLVIGVVTLAYTFLGGVKSVIWNDCLQFVIYICGAIVALVAMIRALPGGLDQFHQFALEHDKLRVFDFEWSFFKPTMTFWAGLIGGGFLTAATHGVDQLTVQRLLTARSQRSAAVALAASGVVVCLQFALFLTIGAALAAFYDAFPPQTPFGANQNDRVFAHFIIHQLPPGLVGITLAAVFAASMTTLSGSLNSSATVLVNDFVIPLTRRELSQPALLRLSRFLTAMFGALQMSIALATYRLGAEESIVNSVLRIASFTSGPMLGLYLLGVLTRVPQRTALGGFFGGLAVVTYVYAETATYWPWYAAIGAATTFTIGWALGLAFQGERDAGETSR